MNTMSALLLNRWCSPSFLLQDPVVTPQGYIFSKAAILQYFLDQKKARKRQLEEWVADEACVQRLVRLSVACNSTIG
jgi:hypothetical protein